MSSTTIKPGQTQQLFLTVDPPDGDLSTLAYSATPDGLVSLAQDEKGVDVTGLKSGVAHVVASVKGEDANGNPATITAECEVTVSRPLVRRLALGPG